MMNPLKCISFITNFGGGIAPAPLSDSDLKGWISGCDACQDACPFNKADNWQEGERFHELEDVVEFLQPRRILDATDQTLWEKVIPRMGYPHRPDQADSLRKCAERTLRYEEGH